MSERTIRPDVTGPEAADPVESGARGVAVPDAPGVAAPGAPGVAGPQAPTGAPGAAGPTGAAA
jgi:hypothetical protein